MSGCLNKLAKNLLILAAKQYNLFAKNSMSFIPTKAYL